MNEIFGNLDPRPKLWHLKGRGRIFPRLKKKSPFGDDNFPIKRKALCFSVGFEAFVPID